jgi:hypothetical protein
MKFLTRFVADEEQLHLPLAASFFVFKVNGSWVRVVSFTKAVNFDWASGLGSHSTGYSRVLYAVTFVFSFSSFAFLAMGD